MTPRLTFVFALSCGVLVANVFLSQALIGLIAPALHLKPALAGLIVTLTQLGYGAGLLLVVSLADLIENRRLALLTVGGTALGLVGVAVANSAATFLVASFVVGFCAVGAQVLVPLAAHLTPEARRGRVIGSVMGGLLAGIMLARPAASLFAALWGWRAPFVIAAAATLAVLATLAVTMPVRRPPPSSGYGQILRSTFGLMRTLPRLRRRSAYQALTFMSFNIFWTSIPLFLNERFGLDQRGIALFALAGAGGALAAPVAGRVADRGWTRPATWIAFGGLTLAFASALVAGLAAGALALAGLVIAAVLLDSAAQTNQVLSQRVVYGLDANARGRLNAAYMTTVFLFGAFGSGVAPWLLGRFGWSGICLTGASAGLALLALHATERK